MDPVIRKLLTPGCAEIIRASQKDTQFLNRLNQEIQDSALTILGQRTSLKWESSLTTLSTVLYHTLTNLAGYQTLGEEYCGILQVDESGSQIPGKWRTAVRILLTTFGYSTLEWATRALESYLRNIQSLVSKSHEQSSTNSALKYDRKLVDAGSDAIKIFKHYLPLLCQLHLAIFYLQGTYYQFSKRLLGIHYLLVRKSYANDDAESRRTLKYLMWITAINSFVACFTYSKEFFKKIEKEQKLMTNPIRKSVGDVEGDITKRCTLCLDQRTNTGLTPCGHLFCWECVIDWLRSKQECPICREQFSPSRVVPLQNYI